MCSFVLVSLALLPACSKSVPIDTPEGEVTLSRLKVEAEPDRVTEVHLSARLSEAVDTYFECAADDDEAEVFQADVAATEEPTAVFYGLRPDTDYTCGIGAAGAALALTKEVTTGQWPDVPSLDAAGDTAAMQGAYTLFNSGPTCDLASPQQVFIVDPEGRIRWMWTVPEEATGDIDTSLLPNGNVLIGGGVGSPNRGDGAIRELGLDWTEHFKRGRPVSGTDYTHQVEQMEDGQLLSLVWQNVDGAYGRFSGFGVEILDPATGQASFDWNSQSAVDAGTLPSGSEGTDYFHANNAEWFPDDPEGPSFWVSLASRNQFVRLDRATGEITWKLGQGGDFTLYDLVGDEVLDGAGWWEFQHANSMELLEDGQVLLHFYDNGYSRGWSRLLDVKVDPTTKTARVVWEWTEPEWVERNGGDHDVLPGGHRLATQGHCACCDESGDRESTVTEIDPTTGDVVWRLTVHGDSEFLSAPAASTAARSSGTRSTAPMGTEPVPGPLPAGGRLLLLLRGVNVGGKNRLPMATLAELVAELGATEVQTYIQSGNVVCRAEPAVAAGLGPAVERLLEARLGVRSPVAVRTAAELAAALVEPPFADQPEDERHLGFLVGTPKPGVELHPARSPGDAAVLRGRELFLHLPRGVAATKLTSDWLDRRLGTVVTIRNWRTVSALQERLAG